MDLLVKNGRLVDPARGIDTVTNVVIRGGKIRALGDAVNNLYIQLDAAMKHATAPPEPKKPA